MFEEARTTLAPLMGKDAHAEAVRLHGLAQFALGERAAGIEDLRSAVQVASANGDLHELATCLGTVGSITNDDHLIAESTTLRRRLGVVGTAEIPIPVETSRDRAPV